MAQDNLKSSRTRILHLAGNEPFERIWSPRFRHAVGELGKLTMIAHADQRTDEEVVEWAREHDVIIINWGSRRLPEELAFAPGKLRYICNATGEIRPYIPRVFIERGIVVSNWGPVPAFGVAEGALALLMTVLKQMIPHHKAVELGEWQSDCMRWRGSIRDLRIGIYGLGVIGRCFWDMVQPLQPNACALDPYCAPWPDGIARVESVDELFDSADAVVITTALTDQTRRSVGAEQLSRLCDGGIIINVARGAIIDQPALFAELESGRLRAGLDVLDTDGNDWIPPGHPARQWTNLVLSAHRISSAPWNEALYQAGKFSRLQRIVLDNLQNFVLGQPIQFTFDLARYDRST